MLERDDMRKQPPDKLFLWHFIKVSQTYINTFYIFFQKKRMLKRGEWVTVSEEQSVSSSGGEKDKKAIRDVPLSLQDKPLAGNNICH